MLCDFYLANHKWPICGVFPVCDVYSGPLKHLVLPDLFSVGYCLSEIFMYVLQQQFDDAVIFMLIFFEHTANLVWHRCLPEFRTNSQNIGSVQVLNYTCDRGTCCTASFIHLPNLLLCSLSQEAILDIKRIRVSYLRTWFIPDVIAAFPIGYILLFAVIMNKLLKQQTANNVLQYLSVPKTIMHLVLHYLFMVYN